MHAARFFLQEQFGRIPFTSVVLAEHGSLDAPL
jgi:hypothetical protein